MSFGNAPRMCGVFGVRVRLIVCGACVQVSSAFDAVIVIGAPELQLKKRPELPALDDARYETRRVRQKFSSGTERQLDSAVRSHILCAVESLERVVQAAIS